MNIKPTLDWKESVTESDSIEQSKEGINYSVFIGFCILVALGSITLYIFFGKGNLVDTDCYMRLIRVTDLYQTGDWYHPAPMKTNTPYGDVSHWTRPFDVLLLAGAVPGSVLVDFRDALFGWGVAISPVLMVLTLIALNWGTRAILSKDGTFLVILLFLSQTVLLSYFLPGRPDHHSLMILLFVLLSGLVLRLAAKPFSISLCCMAGVIGAMYVWVSVESMVPIGLSLGVMGLFWVMQNEDFLKKNLYYSLSLFLFSCVALVLERPILDLLTVEFDRLSIVYCFVFCLISLFWASAWFLNFATNLLQRWTNRLCLSVIGAAVIVFVTWLLFPKILAGPMADVDPRIIPLWLSNIKEAQPLLARSVSLAISVQVLGTAVVSFTFLLYLLLKSREKANRNGWIYITVSAAVFVLLSLFQLRCAVYAQTLLSIVMAELLYRILSLQKNGKPSVFRAVGKGLVTLCFIMGFVYVGALSQKIFRPDRFLKKSDKVAWIQMCDYLNQSNPQTLRILTHLNAAGDILYRTPHEVVGSNYHRNSPGILDSYDAMAAVSDDETLKIIRKRGLDVIIICPVLKDKFYAVKPKQTSTFYQRLCEGQITDWLNPVELPEALNEDFLMYRITDNSTPTP